MSQEKSTTNTSSRFIKVTRTTLFVAPYNWTTMDEETRKRILKEWFGNGLQTEAMSHAYRDRMEIGDSTKLVRVEELDEKANRLGTVLDYGKEPET